MIHRKSINGIKNRKATAASRKNRSTAKEITTIIQLSILSRSLTTLISLLALCLCSLSLSDIALPLPAPMAPAYQAHPVQIPAINLTYTRYTQLQTTNNNRTNQLIPSITIFPSVFIGNSVEWVPDKALDVLSRE